MKNYRSFTDVEESYFRDHPEEMDEYITLMFEECAKDGDTGALLSSLRILSRVKGVDQDNRRNWPKSRKGIQKALYEDGNPEFANVNAIMHAMGCFYYRWRA
jgi:DNA-binding phage protein